MYKGIDSTFIARFRKAIQTEIEDRRYSISQGGITDIVSYKEMCAHIAGLDSSLHIFEELIKKLQDDEE